MPPVARLSPSLDTMRIPFSAALFMMIGLQTIIRGHVPRGAGCGPEAAVMTCR